MGLLDQVISSALGGQQAGGRSSPLMMALMALLANRNGGQGAGMGGLGGLLGGLGGGLGGSLGGGTGPSMGGGLGGLLEQFQRNGRGDTFNSWVNHGQNEPIGPDDLDRTLGPDTVDHLSRETGMPRGDLLSELSRILPGVVDRLTPNGRLPDRSEQDGW
jgi:uncharacterized protein YidB (DUF937 family)